MVPMLYRPREATNSLSQVIPMRVPGSVLTCEKPARRSHISVSVITMEAIGKAYPPKAFGLIGNVDLRLRVIDV
jgi:hypothetical protein